MYSSPDPSGKYGHSKLAVFVTGLLPDDYMLADDDMIWLDVCDGFVEGDVTRESALNAVKKAVKKHGTSMHIDPFELFIDAEICDASCELLPPE